MPMSRKLFLQSLLLFWCLHASSVEILFKKREIYLGGQKITVEVARSRAEVQRGLMFRTKPLSDGEGMLFEFSDEKVRSFWMKNTFIPLSIGFFDRHKKLIAIKEMKPVVSEMERPESYSSNSPAQYALEVRRGWFKHHKVSLGAIFSYSQ